MAYMFVFSSDMGEDGVRKFYSCIEELPKEEGALAEIHPVKFSESDYDSRLGEEHIRYEKDGWVSVYCRMEPKVYYNDDPESWLRILVDPAEEIEVVTTDVSKVVIYHDENEMLDKAFHRMSDFIQYMVIRKELTIYPLEGIKVEEQIENTEYDDSYNDSSDEDHPGMYDDHDIIEKPEDRYCSFMKVKDGEGFKQCGRRVGKDKDRCFGHPIENDPENDPEDTPDIQLTTLEDLDYDNMVRGDELSPYDLSAASDAIRKTMKTDVPLDHENRCTSRPDIHS